MQRGLSVCVCVCVCVCLSAGHDRENFSSSDSIMWLMALYKCFTYLLTYLLTYWKRLNRPGCCLGCELVGHKEPCVGWDQDPRTEMACAHSHAHACLGMGIRTCPDMPAIDILIIVRQGSGAMRPFSTAALYTQCAAWKFVQFWAT